MQHRIFGISKQPGLSNLLLTLDPAASDAVQEKTLNDFIRLSSSAGLWLLPSGPPPPNPSELLGSTKMKEVLQILSKRFDYIIIDSPPILPVTDAVVLSTQVDSVLLVASAGQTARDQLKRSVERLREVNAKIIGSILNGLSRKNDAYSYYYYSESTYYTDEDEIEENGHPTSGENGKSNGLFGNSVWRKQTVTTKDE
jgi:capsular exopolysaccharide synthesis family protein